MVRRHRAAVAMQKWVKGKRVMNKYKQLRGASVVIQSGTIFAASLTFSKTQITEIPFLYICFALCWKDFL